MVEKVGLAPTTICLQSSRSTLELHPRLGLPVFTDSPVIPVHAWWMEIGAHEGTRTLNIELGKLALYY